MEEPDDVVILRLPFKFFDFDGVEWTLEEGVAVGEPDGVDGREVLVVVERLRQLSQSSHRASITTCEFYVLSPLILLTLRATRWVIEVLITNSCAAPFC